MRKCYAIVLTIWAIACIVGCTPGEEAVPPREESFRIECGDAQIILNAPAEPILQALGTPVAYTEETSCAFDGLDKTYYYGSFYMTTYPDGTDDRVGSVWFADDTIATPEGIAIGSTRAAVEAAYEAESAKGANTFIMTRGDSTLTLILTEDLVTTIRYDAVLE